METLKMRGEGLPYKEEGCMSEILKTTPKRLGTKTLFMGVA